MKVLFAVSDENISESIVKKYQQMYKEIILSKNVYYFNAILKEIQKDKTYDRIVISEDLEPFTNNNYDTIDNFIFEKLDSISDEAVTTAGEDIPIILIATERRTKSDNLLIKLFGIGVYSALLGQDRSIEEVCKLIQKPRSKKEAKIYYKIDSNDVEYKPENEGDVSETEIQNILTHYKRLGRNEERYVESFDSIAAQYTDEQLKVIIKFLPLNVKAVLEENSPRYQQLMSFGGSTTPKYNNYQETAQKKRKNNVEKATSNAGIKVESIPSKEKKMTRPVIIPSTTQTKRVENTNAVETKKDLLQEMDAVEQKTQLKSMETNNNEIKEIPTEQPPKRRGRPKKVQIEESPVIQEAPKKKRGRPRKTEIPTASDEFETETMEMLPGFEEEETDTILPGFEQEDNTYQEETSSEVNKQNNFYEEDILPGFEEVEQNHDSVSSRMEQQREEDFYSEPETREIQSFQQTSSNLENLLTQDKKIVAFIGTPKNGTSFLINNLAEMLSNQGIRTAILDVTKNRNSYYIYTKNEEELRKTAYSCTEKLIQGTAQGIKVNHNLDVYTSLPGENSDTSQYNLILETLVRNYSIILLDCDFSTEYGYLKEAQEIYLVQSMDVLTIQPLTAYLRDLKAKGILEQNKLRVVINKYVKVRNVTEKTMIGGMAFYNDPSMSFMTELFNRETIQFCSIPFDEQVYSKYLEGLINCNISLNGYPKEFLAALRKLSNMVYPLISNGQSYAKAKYSNPKYNKYATNTFSNNMNSTLDKMKRNY